MKRPNEGTWLNVLEKIHDSKYDAQCPIIAPTHDRRLSVPDLLKIVKKKGSKTIINVQKSIKHYYLPGSPHKITLPSYLCGDLAYLIGAIMGTEPLQAP